MFRSSKVAPMQAARGRRLGSSSRWHCIIQWHEEGARRPQDHFFSSNPLSCRLSADCLMLKKTFLEEERSNCHFSHAGGAAISESRLELKGHTWKIATPPDAIRKVMTENRLPAVMQETTDIILYGHSAWRTYGEDSGHALVNGEAKQTRGISVEGRFVSAKEVAAFLDRIFGTYGQSNAVDSQLRIWCCNCHMSDVDLNTPRGSYLKRLAHRLYLHGWKNFQIFGFKPEITHHYHLRKIRELAPYTGIGTFDILKQIGSGRSWYVDATGAITTAKSSKKLLGQSLEIGPDDFDFDGE
ncbi:MAG: hypothetical protein A3J38_00985 [Gammaproteobacteria bacterium RIFCSPHIGHO2_12_FULL_45_9]|nr:MAG: hypothetical protein A3J38_00985 [Gammaproteobacteria bacterium RIFCSPHIGHO2_12_FULL_45_9]